MPNEQSSKQMQKKFIPKYCGENQDLSWTFNLNNNKNKPDDICERRKREEVERGGGGSEQLGAI